MGVEMKRYKLPGAKRWVHWSRLLLKPLIKLAVLACVPFGRYPWWMVTPDDPVSPFGSGTTPGASREPTQMAVYERFGRAVGDFVWLGWRNSGYGIAYWLKPDFLKRPGLRYMDLNIVDFRTPGHVGAVDGHYADNSAERVGTLWVQADDGTWLWETTRKIGPLYVITGFRLSAIASGAYEDRWRVEEWMQPVSRPTNHPNMDGRPLVTFRTARTM
jgi:hypothetical protein